MVGAAYYAHPVAVGVYTTTGDVTGSSDNRPRPPPPPDLDEAKLLAVLHRERLEERRYLVRQARERPLAPAAARFAGSRKGEVRQPTMNWRRVALGKRPRRSASG